MARYTEKMREMMTAQMKADIHNTTISLIIDGGWAAFTTENVSRKMGVSRGVLYNYFKNKEAIIVSILNETFAVIYGQMQEIAGGGGSARQKLVDLANLVASDSASRRKFYLAIIENMPPIKDNDNPFIKRHLEKQKIFESVIEEGIAAGEFTRVDADAAAALVSGGIHDICIKSFFSEDPANVSALMDIFLRGISK